MLADTERACDALRHIPPDLPHDEWVRAGMAAQAAGIEFDVFNDWSASAPSYNAQACRDTWRSFKPGKGVGAGTLFKLAAENGWRMGADKRQQKTPQPTRKAAEPQRQPAHGKSPTDVWSRCNAPTNSHPYIVKKKAAGVPLDNLRVLPAGDTLSICGESMAGSLVVPVHRVDGSISTLQFIAPPDVADRLKAKGKRGKLNLPGCPVQGWHTVGELVPGGVAYIVEGIGAAWSCWKATGAAAVACFGAGNMGKVANALREQDPSTRLVVVPDVGKETDAQKIALAVGAAVALMPDGWPLNSDVNDLAQRDGGDVLAALLESATEPPIVYPLSVAFADELPDTYTPPDELVQGVLTAGGGSMLYGDTNSGKTFFAIGMGAAVARGV
jgi:putative DNA primase/helicase